MVNMFTDNAVFIWPAIYAAVMIVFLLAAESYRRSPRGDRMLGAAILYSVVSVILIGFTNTQGADTLALGFANSIQAFMTPLLIGFPTTLFLAIVWPKS